jgi:hypothetical protein
MAVDSATYPGDFDTAKPPNSDPKSEGAANFRQVKTALKNAFPNVTGAVTPTHTVLNYMLGVTSAVQTQLDAKAPTASPTFTGTPAAPTAAAGTNTTQIATMAALNRDIAAAAMSSTTPTVSGDAGKVWGSTGSIGAWISDLKASVMRFVDGTDATKKVAFDVSGVTTATTRTLTIPNSDGTIALLGNSASQAQMEEGTNIYTFATPANVQWHQSAAKAWIKCDAAGAIAASYNVTSIADDGPGAVTVTIAADFSSADYTIVPSVLTTGGATGVFVRPTAQSAGAFTLGVLSTGFAAADPTAYYAACYGDQA